MPSLYIDASGFLRLAGGADRVQGIAGSDDLEGYLLEVLEGAEGELDAGIQRAGLAVPVPLETIEDEDQRAKTKAFLGRHVAGLAAEAIGGPDHLLPLAKIAREWLKALQKGESGIPGLDKPAESIARRPRAFKVTSGEKNIPRALFTGMARIGGSR